MLCETMTDQPRQEGPALTWHRPVLVEETIELLQPVPGTTFVDCTTGTGGHSLALLPHLGRLIAIDRDAAALAQAKQRLTEFHSQVTFVQDSFSRLPEILAEQGLTQVHGVIADLGMSSLQVEDPSRGFSFRQEGPLDMRMDQRGPLTAAEIVRTYHEDELADLLQEIGQERWARRIAHRIVQARAQQPITTTTQLAQIISEAVPGRRPSRHSPRWRGSAAPRGRGGLHPATRTFMALRIAVNQEAEALTQLLKALPDVLLPGGRAAIITFHSMEDRLVKHTFAAAAREGIYRLLTKKPVRPSEQEEASNPRSRSAKLRAVERL